MDSSGFSQGQLSSLLTAGLSALDDAAVPADAAVAAFASAPTPTANAQKTTAASRTRRLRPPLMTTSGTGTSRQNAPGQRERAASANDRRLRTEGHRARHTPPKSAPLHQRYLTGHLW